MSDTAIMNEMMKLEFKIDQIFALNYKADYFVGNDKLIKPALCLFYNSIHKRIQQGSCFVYCLSCLSRLRTSGFKDSKKDQ